MSNDQINGTIESVGGLLLFLNCYRLYKDKQVKGISILPIIFFNCWGIWNLTYYPSLNQNWSFYGALIVFSANTTWVIMAIKYSLTVKKTQDKSY